jgi:hypothetical protein
MGDGLFPEFSSVVDAVECAVSWRRGLAERNASFPRVERTQVRTGINLGAGIVEGEDRWQWCLLRAADRDFSQGYDCHFRSVMNASLSAPAIPQRYRSAHSRSSSSLREFVKKSTASLCCADVSGRL